MNWFSQKIPGMEGAGSKEQQAENLEQKKKVDQEKAQDIRGEIAALMDTAKEFGAKLDRIVDEKTKIKADLEKFGSDQMRAPLLEKLRQNEEKFNQQWEINAEKVKEFEAKFKRLENRAEALEKYGVDLEERESELTDGLAEKGDYIQQIDKKVGAKVAEGYGNHEISELADAFAAYKMDSEELEAIKRGEWTQKNDEDWIPQEDPKNAAQTTFYKGMPRALQFEKRQTSGERGIGHIEGMSSLVQNVKRGQENLRSSGKFDESLDPTVGKTPVRERVAKSIEKGSQWNDPSPAYKPAKSGK